MLVLSWNINAYIIKDQDIITKTDYIIKEIKKINPDILLLQEASKYFLSRISSCYFCYGFVMTHAGLCATLTRSDNLFVKNVRKYKTGISIYLENIIINNCHLTPHYSNSEIRTKELDIMTEENIIIFGDTNMTRTETYCLNDVAKDKDNLADTWFYSYFEKGSKVSRRFTRAYTDLDTSKMEYTIYPDYKHLSDHIPVSIKIDFSETKEDKEEFMLQSYLREKLTKCSEKHPSLYRFSGKCPKCEISWEVESEDEWGKPIFGYRKTYFYGTLKDSVEHLL